MSLVHHADIVTILLVSGRPKDTDDRIDFACVDVLFLPDGRPLVLEINGAPDFTAGYSFDGSDVFEVVVRALRVGCSRPGRVAQSPTRV